MKVYFLQRFLAYFIDSFIVLGIVTLLTFFVPITSTYEKALEESKTIMDSYLDGELTNEEYLSKYGQTSYVIAKENMLVSFVNIIVVIAYFGTYAYYKNGQTIGKKLMKFKIDGEDNKEPSHFMYIVRAVLVQGVLTSFCALISLFFITASSYYYVVGIIDIIYLVFFIITLIMILFRKDGRGLHDIICKTKVIAIK